MGKIILTNIDKVNLILAIIKLVKCFKIYAY